MLCRIKTAAQVKFSELKTLINDNKVLFYLTLGSVVFGLIWAFSRAFSDTAESANVYVLITSGQYTFFTYLLRNLLLFGLFGGLLFVGSFQFYIGILSFVGVTISVYAFSVGYIASVFLDGFAGILIFLLYFVPILCFLALAYFVAAARIQNLTCSSCKKTYFINIAYFKLPIAKIIISSLLPSFIFVGAMTILVLLISLI